MLACGDDQRVGVHFLLVSVDREWAPGQVHPVDGLGVYLCAELLALRPVQIDPLARCCRNAPGLVTP